MFPKIQNTFSKGASKNSVPEVCYDYDYILRFDGCSKGNPGTAGAGAVIYHLDKEISANHFYVGDYFTNNHAEYAGLILGLQKAIELGIKKMLVEGDSLLVINQMKGTYQCKSANLIELYEKAKELEKHFDQIEYNHILRNKNKRADQLSNLGLNDNIFQVNDESLIIL